MNQQGKNSKFAEVEASRRLEKLVSNQRYSVYYHKKQQILTIRMLKAVSFACGLKNTKDLTLSMDLVLCEIQRCMVHKSMVSA